MTPDSWYRPLRGVLKALFGFFLVAVWTAPAVSQRLVHPGATIRIGSETGDWLRARVIRATSREFLVEMPDADETLLLINESTRLQILRGRTSPGYYGAAVGALLGGLVGAIAFEDRFRFRASGGFHSRAQAALVFGALGAAVGWIIGHHGLGTNHWDNVPMRRGSVVFPPLDPAIDREETLEPLGPAQRWNRFEPTFSDFRAFFDEYTAQLRPIEGLWDVGLERPVAIVRDRRFGLFDYIIVSAYAEPSPDDQRYRLVLGAIGSGGYPDEFEVRWVEGLRGSDRVAWSPWADVGRVIDPETLQLESSGGGITYGTKVFPAKN